MKKTIEPSEIYNFNHFYCLFLLSWKKSKIIKYFYRNNNVTKFTLNNMIYTVIQIKKNNTFIKK